MPGIDGLAFGEVPRTEVHIVAWAHDAACSIRGSPGAYPSQVEACALHLSRPAHLDRPGVITQQLHTLTDKDREASWDSSDYRRYLIRMYGFVLPVERSIQSTLHIGSYIDVRRFQKHELLRRDLMALRMTAPQIEAIALCAVPVFDTPEEAFGWASLIERNTLHHAELFHRLASTNPGDAAFAAAFLKCYYGVVGEMWKSFRHAMEAFQGAKERRERLVAGTKAALRCYESWRLLHERRAEIVDAAAALAPASDEP